eukprot:7287359-Prymnesium_polylepis.1
MRVLPSREPHFQREWERTQRLRDWTEVGLGSLTPRSPLPSDAHCTAAPPRPSCRALPLTAPAARGRNAAAAAACGGGVARARGWSLWILLGGRQAEGVARVDGCLAQLLLNPQQL